MTNLIIHPEVSGDIIDGAEWYGNIDPELAECYQEEVYLAIELARANPEQYNKVYGHYRRILCRRFPYKVIFEIVEAGQAIHVLAVLHASRHPENWKDRI